MTDIDKDALWISRDEINEQGAMVAHYSNLMRDFAEVGDDHGVAYAYRRSLAHMRMVAAALELIVTAHNQHDREARA